MPYVDRWDTKKCVKKRKEQKKSPKSERINGQGNECSIAQQNEGPTQHSLRACWDTGEQSQLAVYLLLPTSEELGSTCLLCFVFR